MPQPSPNASGGATTMIAVVPFEQRASQQIVSLHEQRKLGAGSGDKTGQGFPLSTAPAPAWDVRHDATANSDAEDIPWHLKLENGLLVVLATLDNALCYVTWYVLRGYDGRLYNILDLHLVLLPGLDVALLILSVLGTTLLLSQLALVECMGLPLFHELMNARLCVSALPCSVCCSIFAYMCERVEWIPFTSLATTFCFVFVWCLHMRVHYSHQLQVLSKIALDISWSLALLLGIVLAVLYSADAMKEITKSDELGCPYVNNEAVPVRVLSVDRWYCAKWGDDTRVDISRRPVPGSPRILSCSDSFLTAFGVSIDAHTFECPSGCLRISGSGGVVGCGVYAVDSSLCLAAIHAGVLTDSGGQATVFGRAGVPKYERCSRNSVTTIERQVAQVGQSVTMSTPSGGGSSTFVVPSFGGRRLQIAAPMVLSADGAQLPAAFHFNNEAHVAEYIWLKQYDRVASGDTRIQADKPWTRIDGTVSLRVAGIELEDEKVRLGQHENQRLFRERTSAQASSAHGQADSPDCTVQSSGVLCRGAGVAVVELDFCRPEVKSCLDN